MAPLSSLTWVFLDPIFQSINLTSLTVIENTRGFPGGTVVKNPPANAGDTGSSPGPGRSHILWNN